jgi:hypothetical protein
MLPAGLTADLAASSEQRSLKTIHPTTQTVARILAGQCSCDLVRQRLSYERSDERHLRERYRHIGMNRQAMIAALERHRRDPRPPVPDEGWPVAFSKFVAEHARNAGPTLYLLRFEPDDSSLDNQVIPTACSLNEIRQHSNRWLIEGTPTIVG